MNGNEPTLNDLQGQLQKLQRQSEWVCKYLHELTPHIQKWIESNEEQVLILSEDGK